MSKKTFVFLLPLLCVLVALGDARPTTINAFNVSNDRPMREEMLDVPAGFVATRIVRRLQLPTDIEFLPNGDLFILEKGSLVEEDDESELAALKLYKNGQLRTEPVLQLRVHTINDKGAIGLVLDPNFESNGYFYIYHSVVNTDRPDLDIPVYERISRFTYDHAREIAPVETQKTIIDIYYHGMFHAGGGLIFDGEGNLYLGIGDFNTPESQALTQDPTTHHGTMIRIRPTYDESQPPYTIPSDNPFANGGAGLPEVYAYGLRNPFRMSHRAADNMIVIGDVGRSHYEEINIAQLNGNFGWPIREGRCARATWEPCEAADSQFTNPQVSIPHAEIDEIPQGAITGVAFYEGTTWPVEYENKVFFIEWTHNYIAAADLNTGEWFEFADGIYRGSDLAFHDNKLYFLSHLAGYIEEYQFTGTDNNVPVVSMSADNTIGAAPLTVTFTAEASDADGDALTYHWDFGDGTTMTSTTPTVSHTYTSDQTTATILRVFDSNGMPSQEVSEQVTVYSGTIPQIGLSNLSAAERGTEAYHAGDLLSYEVDLPAAEMVGKSFKWDVVFHHLSHVHPFITGEFGESGTLEIPRESHDGDYRLWYEWILTMYTETGQQVQVAREAFPQTMNITVGSIPAVQTVLVNGGGRTTQFTYESIVGQENTLQLTQTLPPTRTVTLWQSSMINRYADELTFYAHEDDTVHLGTLFLADPGSGIIAGTIMIDEDTIPDSGNETRYDGTAFITLDGSDLSITVQQSNGTFLFTGLPMGNYQLTVVLEDEAQGIRYGSGDIVTLTNEQPALTMNVGLFESIPEQEQVIRILLPIISRASE